MILDKIGQAAADAAMRRKALDVLIAVCDAVRGCTFGVAPIRFLESQRIEFAIGWEARVDWKAYADCLVNECMLPAVRAMKQLEASVGRSPSNLIMADIQVQRGELKERATLLQQLFWSIYVDGNEAAAAIAVASDLREVLACEPGCASQFHAWFDKLHQDLLACLRRWEAGEPLEFATPPTVEQTRKRKRPGPKIKYSLDADRRVQQLWQSGKYPRLAALGSALNLSKGEIRAALDRDRKRVR
jgi:hypothetical protein